MLGLSGCIGLGVDFRVIYRAHRVTWGLQGYVGILEVHSD